MLLETIVNTYNRIDTELKRQYTQLGHRIPEKHLYKVTSALCLGNLVWGLKLIDIYSGFPGLITAPLGALDAYHNLCGIRGEITTAVSQDGSITYDPSTHGLIALGRLIRVPYMLASIGLVCKGWYDIVQTLIMNDTTYVNTTLADFGIGMTFLSIASSYYLKDQDPKLLDKKRRSVLDRLGDVYTAVKESLMPTPQPIPVPIPVTRQRYL